MKKSSESVQKRKWIVAIIALGIVSIIVFLFFLTTYFVNNLRLLRFSEQLVNVDMPEDTVIVETKTACGKLVGNGDGMDYVAVVLLKTSLSEPDLKAYFEDVQFYSAKNNSSHDVYVEISKANRNFIQSDYIQNISLFYKHSDFSSNYYTVVIFDGGYSNIFDLRGA